MCKLGWIYQWRRLLWSDKTKNVPGLLEEKNKVNLNKESSK